MYIINSNNNKYYDRLGVLISYSSRANIEQTLHALLMTFSSVQLFPAGKPPIAVHYDTDVFRYLALLQYLCA